MDTNNLNFSSNKNIKNLPENNISYLKLLIDRYSKEKNLVEWDVAVNDGIK